MLSGPASRSLFFEGEFVVNPILRSAPRRSAVVTEPAAEVDTVIMATYLSCHGIDPRRRQSPFFDSDGKRVLMMFLRRTEATHNICLVQIR